MQEVVFDLSKNFTDILTLVLYVILSTYGFKSIIKNITKKDEVNKFISMGIVLVLSMVSTLFLPIGIWWAKVIMGVIITGVSIGFYEPVVKHLLEAIPTIVQAFATKVSNNTVVKKITKKKK